MENNPETKIQNSDDQVTSIGGFIWELIKILVIAIAIIVPFRYFVAEPFIVSGLSMYPTFHDKEYLIINKFSYIIGSPERGDVIVLKFPKDPKEYFIKRVVGLPGDTLKIDKGSVYICNTEHPNCKELDEDYLKTGILTVGGPQSITLNTGEYFVMGDNRPASNDSRSWGVLEEKYIVGKASVRVLPLSRFSIFSYHTPLK